MAATSSWSTANSTPRWDSTAKKTLQRHCRLRPKFWPRESWGKLLINFLIMMKIWSSFLANRVNFKKNEKTYDPGNSDVFKMVQELDRAPREPEPGIDIDPADASPAQKGLGGLASRTIQSRTFQRIHQQAVRSLEQTTTPTSPILLSPNTSMEGRSHSGPRFSLIRFSQFNFPRIKKLISRVVSQVS